MRAFRQSRSLVTVAEMGDKSQLVSLAFTTRFRASFVLAGVFSATFLVHLASVALGRFLVTFLPGLLIAPAAGLAFLGFGVWTLRGDKLEDDFPGRTKHLSTWLILKGWWKRPRLTCWKRCSSLETVKYAR